MTEPEYGIPTAPPASSTTATDPATTTTEPRTAAPPSCGKAAFSVVNQFTVSAGGSALSCFATAVRQCRAASISVVEFSVDTGSKIVATVKPGTPCRAHYVSTNYANGATVSSTNTDCDVSVSTISLHFNCPGGTDDWPVGASS